jgi:hypothetical protein
MPISVKDEKPVSMAQTPEFKALQDKVAAAKSVLDEVMTAIASLESKAGPQGGQAVQPATQNSGSMYNYQGVPGLDVQESIKYNELERIVTLTGR